MELKHPKNQMFKYVSVHPDAVPKDLPFNTKFEIRNISEEGVEMGDPKLGWKKVNYYVINLIHKTGTVKKGSSIKSLGEIICYNFYSKKEAIEHAYFYKDNPRYIGNPFKKIILGIIFIYASLFPKSGLIQESKSLQELEDEGELHLGI